LKIFKSIDKQLKLSAIAFLCFLCPMVVLAQNSNKIYTEIYSYNFSEAYQSLKNQKHEPKAEAALWVNYYWWLAISGENEAENFANCNLWLKKLEAVLTNEKNKNNEYLFYKVMLHAYQSRLSMFFKNYLKAGLNLHYCNTELKTSIQKIEEFDKFYFSSGLYYYFVEKSLTDYPILYAYLAFFPKGDKNTGIQFLKKATENTDIMVRTESLYFLMRIYFEFEKNYATSLIYVNKLIEMYPQNLVFRYYKVQILKKAGYKTACETEVKNLNITATNNKALSSVQQSHFGNILRNQSQMVVQ